MKYYLITLIRETTIKRHVILAPSIMIAEKVAQKLAHYENFSEYVVSDLLIEASI